MTSMRIKFTFALMVLLTLPISQATTISVPGDHATIQAAIDNASPGDVIEVESGIYVENVNVDKPLTLRGLGMPTVDAGGKGSAITLSADGITLEGFNATNSSREGIKITSDYNSIKGNNANANRLIGIKLDESSNNNIEGNNASRNDQGIRLYYSSNNTLEGNRVNYNKGEGIVYRYSYNNIMRDNQEIDITSKLAVITISTSATL
jgi:parallel beta-helix repeat protein